jgi:hypothetical protein
MKSFCVQEKDHTRSLYRIVTTLVLASMIHISVLLLNEALPEPTFGYNGAERPLGVIVNGAVTPIETARH